MVMWVGVSFWCVIPVLCGQMVQCEPLCLLRFLYCVGRWSCAVCLRFCVALFFAFVFSHYYLEVVVCLAVVFIAVLVSRCVNVCCLGVC